jgi:hypothetical protein
MLGLLRKKKKSTEKIVGEINSATQLYNKLQARYRELDAIAYRNNVQENERLHIELQMDTVLMSKKGVYTNA